MRDPKRIDKYLAAVKKVWEKYPDMRFGQLFCNVFGLHVQDPFYAEDGESVKWWTADWWKEDCGKEENECRLKK